MEKQIKDSPGVIAPPPLIFLGGLLIGGILHWFYRISFLPEELSSIAKLLGGGLIFAGLGIVLIAKVKMKKAKTNIEPWKPTTAIIDDGIYAYSRNPIYIAMVLMYLSVILIVNSVWFFPFLILVLLAIQFGVILREEKYLEIKFGEEYLSYKNKVRRWF